ncbi:hypothetical protein D3C78_1748430 [compost metagenome]
MTKKRKASGTPFHCFDIHMPNHSPPTDIKATCQVRKPNVNPAMAKVLARLKLAAGNFRPHSRRIPPIQHKIAVRVSNAIMPIYPT